jgi:hypothetical protein
MPEIRSVRRDLEGGYALSPVTITGACVTDTLPPLSGACHPAGLSPCHVIT